MALFFITGNSGTGKSTLYFALKERGFEAYDTDIDGFAKWHNDETGFIHPKSSVKPEHRTPEFISTHSWKVVRSEIEDLVVKAESHPVFLCGVVSSVDQIQDLFRLSFALVVDDDTLSHRLATRPFANSWGKSPHERQATLSRQRQFNEAYKEAGHTMIDATLPVKKVVDLVISYAEERELQ